MTTRSARTGSKASDDTPKVRGLLRRRTRELDAVREIFHAINATSDLRSILDTIVRTTAKAMGADSASISRAFARCNGRCGSGPEVGTSMDPSHV